MLLFRARHICFHSYRKVAADKCTTEKNDFVKPYRPTEANCPVVKPGGLDVTMSSKHAAVPKKPVVFHLTQETVSVWSLSGQFLALKLHTFMH